MTDEPKRWKKRKRVLPKRRGGWTERLVTLPNGVRIRLGILVSVVIGLLLFAGFCLGVILLLYSAEEEAKAKVVRVAEPGSDEGPATVQGKEEPFGPGSSERLGRILRKHSESTGLESVQSLILQGTYNVNGIDYDTTLVVRRPGMVRHVLDAGTYEIVRVFDGEDSVTGAFDYDGRRLELELGQEATNLYSLRVEGALGFLAWNCLDRTEGFKVEATGAGVVNGVDCAQVLSTDVIGTKMEHLIDVETGRELARRVRFVDGNVIHGVEVHLSDFRHIEGMDLPMSYEVFVDGAAIGSARFDSVRKNAGVMPGIFTISEDDRL